MYPIIVVIKSCFQNIIKHIVKKKYITRTSDSSSEETKNDAILTIMMKKKIPDDWCITRER